MFSIKMKNYPVTIHPKNSAAINEFDFCEIKNDELFTLYYGLEKRII